MVVTVLGKNLSIALLLDAYPLLIWGFGNQSVGMVVAVVMRSVVKVPGGLAHPFDIAMSFGNAGTLPLVLVETLSRQQPLSSDPEALDKLTTFIFMYLVSWLLSFFSFGLTHLERGWPSLDRGASTWARSVKVAVTNPVIISVFLGLVIGLYRPVQAGFFGENAELRFASSAAETLARPAVGVMTLLMSASVGGFIETLINLQKEQAGKEAADAVTTEGLAKTVHNPGVSVILNMESAFPTGDCAVDCTPDADDNTGSTDSTLSSPDSAYAGDELGEFGFVVLEPPPIKSNELPSVDSKSLELADPPTEGADEIPVRALAALVIGRVVVMPVINLCVVIFLADYILPDSPDRPLMKLVLAIEAATPSADSAIVLCQQYRQMSTAEALAASYVFQYLFGLVSLAVSIGISMDQFF